MAQLNGFDPSPIPGPRALPFFGVKGNIVRILVDPIERLADLRRRYGDVVAAVGGNPEFVYVFGAERNREVLSKPALFENDTDFFVHFPEGTNVRLTVGGLPFIQGEEHRKHRRLMMPAFQKSALDGYAEDIVAVTDSALKRWPVGQTADISALIRDLVQGVAAKCFFGVSADKTANGLAQAITDLIDLVASPLTVGLPLRIRGLPYAKVFDIADDIARELRGLFAEKRTISNKRDVLSLLLSARDEDGSQFSEDALIAEAVTIYVAGHDTQAKTLCWTLFLLEQHPDILADVVDEISSVVRGGPPTPAHIPKLPLLDRVIKESQRVLASVPLLFIRLSHSAAQLGSYSIPKGSKVLLCPFLTHRDPSLYTEPTRFLPSRWERIQPSLYEYMPFGAGSRLCIGMGFATMSLRLILAMILERFRLSLAFNARITAQVRSNILRPKYGMPMLIAPQDRRFARQPHLRGNIASLVDL